MNLPLVSSRELTDQSLAPDQRSALWSQVLVRAMVENAGQSTWMTPRPVEAQAIPERRLAS